MERYDQISPRQILERICNNAEYLMLEKSKFCRWVDFKSSFCLRFNHNLGWGLVVYDSSSGNEMAWVRSPATGRVLNLGETFIRKARSEENNMMLEASIGDGSIHLPVLGKPGFKLSDDCLKAILECVIANGAVVSFETFELEDIKRRQTTRRKELMSDVAVAEKEFGKTSLQANAARRIALQEMMKMPKELDAGRLEIPIISRSFSCVEEFLMNLVMLEADGESKEEK